MQPFEYLHGRFDAAEEQIQRSKNKFKVNWEDEANDVLDAIVDEYEEQPTEVRTLVTSLEHALRFDNQKLVKKYTIELRRHLETI